MLLPFVFGISVVLLASPRHVVLSSPPRNDWSTLDLTELEEEWKSDEDVDDLKSRDDHLYDLLERERKSAMNKLQTLLHDEGGGGGMQKNDKALKRAALDAQHAGKSVMIFATLRNDRVPDDGDGWAWNSMAAVCDKWSNWLGHALVDISCYPIEPTSSNDNDNDPDVVSSSILITSARSWDGEDIHRFLVNHPHPKRIVSKVIWNDRTTTLL